MIWVTWRHHRLQIAACLTLVAAATLLLHALGAPMHAAWAAGPAGCLTLNATDSCNGLLADFQSRFTGPPEQLLGWLNLLPPLVGAFVGAPLLAREFETGTWRLAFTQAVTRSRWIAVKVLLLGTAVVTLMAVFAAVFGWYRAPLDHLEGRFSPNAYNFEGLMLPAYTLFAFAVGVLAGVLLRRTLAAMAVTIGVFLAVRVPVETWLRPHLQNPVLLTGPAAASNGAARANWLLSSGLTDEHGYPVSAEGEAHVQRAARASGGPVEHYLDMHGYGHWARVQPAERFWHFQILEGSLYLILALTCLAASVLILRRRPR